MLLFFYGNEAVSCMRAFEYFDIFRVGRDDLENDRWCWWQVRRQLRCSTEHQQNLMIS